MRMGATEYPRRPAAVECGDLSPLLAGDLSPSKIGDAVLRGGISGSRQRFGAREFERSLRSDGDKSPGESGDKSPHSARRIKRHSRGFPSPSR